MSDFLNDLKPGDGLAIVDKETGRSWPARVVSVTERQIGVEMFPSSTGHLSPSGDRFTRTTGRAIGRCFQSYILAPPPHQLATWLYQIWLGLEKASDKVPSAHNQSAVLQAWRAYEKVVRG